MDKKSKSRKSKRLFVPPQTGETLDNMISVPFDKLEKLYLGKAGELLVNAHLLRRGFNAMPLSIDSGIDILAHYNSANGDNLIYQFQVKTTRMRRTDLQFFGKELDRLWVERINLVVVFWPPSELPTTIVFPPSVLRFMSSAVNGNKALIRRAEQDRSILAISRLVDGSFRIPATSCELSPLQERYDRCEHIKSELSLRPDYLDWPL